MLKVLVRTQRTLNQFLVRIGNGFERIRNNFDIIQENRLIGDNSSG